MNNLQILWLLYQQGNWYSLWVFVAMDCVIAASHALSLYNLLKRKDFYYRNRWRFIMLHRVIRAFAFYIGSSFMQPDDFVTEPFHGLLGLDQTRQMTSTLSFVRTLVLRSGCMLGCGYVFIFPTNFSLTLGLHIACLPGFLRHGADTAKYLQRPEYWGHTCAVYNSLEGLVPGLDYHTHSKADDTGCNPHAPLVLAHTVSQLLHPA